MVVGAANTNDPGASRQLVYHGVLTTTARHLIGHRKAGELARHCTEAALIEKAAGLWGKAGQRSLARAALVEAAEQLTRALNQIANLPATPALRREQIKLQVALINSLMFVKGYAAPETEAATERARLLIKQAEAFGEPPEDPLLLYSVLYGPNVQKFIVFNGDAACTLATQFLALAEKQRATIPVMIGHGLLGTALLIVGDLAEGLAQLDRAMALYDPAAHRPLVTRFGQDIGVRSLNWRPLALWMLGYPGTALSEAERPVKAARETGHAPTLLFASGATTLTHVCSRAYGTANARIEHRVTSSVTGTPSTATFSPAAFMRWTFVTGRLRHDPRGKTDMRSD